MKLENRNVLVTGGAGFIGSHLVDRIAVEKPARLVAVDNLFLGREENLDQARRICRNLKIYNADASDYAAMRRIVDAEQIDVVFNLAAIPLPTSLELPKWTVETNVAIAIVFCELAREDRYRTLIHCSSSECYGTAQYLPMDEKHPLLPTTPYAASKIASDHVVLAYERTFGTDCAIVRPFNTYGPRQNARTYAGVIPIVINRVLDKRPIEIFGDGGQTRDFIFVRETVGAMVRVYEETRTRGKIINIATGQEISINHLVQTLREVMGGEDSPVLHTAPRPGDVRRHCGDICLARELIEFNPKMSLVEGLRETIDWYVQQRCKQAQLEAAK